MRIALAWQQQRVFWHCAPAVTLCLFHHLIRALRSTWNAELAAFIGRCDSNSLRAYSFQGVRHVRRLENMYSYSCTSTILVGVHSRALDSLEH